jgi:hypothetical protein
MFLGVQLNACSSRCCITAAVLRVAAAALLVLLLLLLFGLVCKLSAKQPEPVS